MTVLNPTGQQARTEVLKMESQTTTTIRTWDETQGDEASLLQLISSQIEQGYSSGIGAGYSWEKKKEEWEE